MPVLPTAASFQVLLACSEAVQSKHRWVHLTAAEVPGLAGMEAQEIQQAVSELSEHGYCAPAAYGELMYITREGAKLAKVARELVSQGASITDLTLDALTPALKRFPFFRLPEEFTPARSSSAVA
jgi:hypothetical protein